MKKSKLSMTSLICGITATTVGILLFPLSLTMGKTHSGLTIIGFLGFIAISSGLIGTISGIVKKMSTPDDTEENKNDRAIANKGFWFSVIPTAFWIFIMMLGSIN